MCCCCSLKAILIILTTFGVLTFLGGVATLGLSAFTLFETSWLMESESDTFVDSANKWLTAMLLTSGCLGVLVGGTGMGIGCSGFYSGETPRYLTTFCFGFWSLVSMFFMVVVCIPIIALYFVKPEHITAFCDDSLELPSIF